MSSKSRQIRVFEFEKLTLSEDSRGNFLMPDELLKLYDFNDRNGNIYFEGIRDGVKFKNYVGVIQIGSLTIEILPKTDRKKSTKEDCESWQKALISMLKVCKLINVSSVSEANLKRRYNSILDLYFEMFLNEIDNLLHQGLIKKYRKKSGNVLALKGHIEFSKNIQQNLIHQERFYTNHQIYDYNHLLHQILLKAVHVLENMSTNPSIQERIVRIKANFPEVKIIELKATHFDKIELNRKTMVYEKSLQIAKMILLNYSPDLRAGGENMITLLFDMNKLWEEYIFRMLLKVKNTNLEIKSQRRQKFWESKIIKPDIVITNYDSEVAETYIIDTKWIVFNNEIIQPSDADLKQMYSYNMYWNATKSMLLYPGNENINEQFGKFWKGKESPDDNQCKLGFINVLNNEGTLDFEIGTKILGKIIRD